MRLKTYNFGFKGFPAACLKPQNVLKWGNGREKGQKTESGVATRFFALSRRGRAGFEGAFWDVSGGAYLHVAV